jgi:membrane associated rhomboid family serine protease
MRGLEDRGGLSMEDALLKISARSKRRAMEWGLVLASQGIEAVIDKSDDGWFLLVEPKVFDRAQATLRQYHTENRGWQWKHPLPQTDLLFHWGSVGWVAAIVAIYYWSAIRFPGIRGAGILDSVKVRQGQWWRLWTSVTLHHNLEHLMANAAIGFILMGLAMARYGAGMALLAAFLAGIVGNLADLAIYSEPHQSLGASGMVMGALGLITVQTFSFWRQYRFGGRFVFRAVASGAMILALIGFSPDSDIVAHIGGFVAGAIFGCGLAYVAPERLQRGPINAAALLLLAALLLATWRLALRAP